MITSDLTFRVTAGAVSAMYQVKVLDENDNTPTFRDGSYYDLTLSEDVVVSGWAWSKRWAWRSGCVSDLSGDSYQTCYFATDPSLCMRLGVIVQCLLNGPFHTTWPAHPRQRLWQLLSNTLVRSVKLLYTAVCIDRRGLVCVWV